MHAGRVKVFSNRVWGRASGSPWTWRKQEAAGLCRQLGFAVVITALNYLPSGLLPYFMSWVNCVGTEKELQQCQNLGLNNSSLGDSNRDVGVFCKPHLIILISIIVVSNFKVVCAIGDYFSLNDNDINNWK